MRVDEIKLHRVNLLLSTPYKLSYRTFETFEPILVEVRDSDGRGGLGEQHISPGSSAETREHGWRFVRDMAERIVGGQAREGIDFVSAQISRSPVAATALVSALEMLSGGAGLETAKEARLPLLSPFEAGEPKAIAEELERRMGEGFRTFKIKIGKDVNADLARVAAIQEAGRGRVTLRLDANRAFTREQGIAFASALDPQNIALFEQPCASDDWEANAAVARASRVPLMLDEPICALGDIDRASTLQNIGLCKLKLKRFGSLERLESALNRVRDKGMEAVLGDGLGAEINCWMEGCVARRTIDNAGEFNGYLKVRPEARLLVEPLPFANGHMIIPKNYWPQLDQTRLARASLETVRFAPTRVSAAQ